MVLAAALIVVGAGVVGLIALALSRGAQGPDPSFGGRIVVVTADGSIETMTADGGAIHHFPLADGTFLFPSWSPDGTRVAAIGVHDDAGAIFVLADGAQNPEALPEPIYESAERPPFYLYWSPDGTRVTFLTTEADGLALRVADAGGSTPATVVRRGAPFYWDWTGDSELLVHVGGTGPAAFVGASDLTGSTGASRGIPGRFQAPVVSPVDGSLAFVRSTTDPAGEVVIADATGAEVTSVPVSGPTALGWSPAAAELAFIEPDAGSALPIGRLRIAVPGGRVPRTISDHDVVAFFWAPDGRTVAVLQLPRADDRQVARTGVSGRAVAYAAARPGTADAGPADAGPAPAARPGPADAGPAAAEGELRLAFIDPASGTERSSRSVRVAATFVRQLLPYFDQYALSHRLWSPDGRVIVLPLVGDVDGAQVTVLPADGSEARPIAPGEIAFWAP